MDNEQALFNEFMDILGDTLTPEQEKRLSEEIKTRSFASRFAERKRRQRVAVQNQPYEDREGPFYQ